ncbi:type III pantothenate kinase [Paraflavisolibacter sp. H34]|uniref:type III pantothenate kinase n=1 Tax=Huijunlia imazamoxiresistens TaxID=3127457 RepID=UPI003016343B
MTPTLCLDFGNTRLKGAVFYGDRLEQTILFPEEVLPALEEVLQQYRPARSILASVVDHPAEVERLLSGSTQFHKLTHESKLPFRLGVSKPQSTGTDRLALVAAAVQLFPGQHNLAIGLGSCITYNFVNKYNEYLGGAISPGMEMRLKALNHYTAKLPLVPADWNVPLIGYDTPTNIQSGVVLGMAKEIDGIISEYRERYGNFNALLTGGDIAFFGPHLKSKIFANPDLIFNGLYAISKVNNV